tara:strand:+ start:546 stop:869 length:324 start_codon:yes stop_codon:yes gene_type:complete
MITISLEPADNGLIKFLIDDNVNGGGEEYTSRVVYEFEGITGRANQIKFLKDLVLDLGLSVGNDMDRDMVSIKTEWGKQYVPNSNEIKSKVGELEREIKRLRSLEKK